MAFKTVSQAAQVPDSPEMLLRLLSRRRIPDVLPHQSAMMQQYVATGINEPDVALQLPTGSGKTLVGLLIAEWRRRRNHEKVVYLCPTRQLVNQVVEQANDKYGLTVLGFTGSRKHYDPSAKAQYRTGDHVAVTTYSSVFNSSPFFHDADILILDDAHTAEAYVAGAWSVSLNANDPGESPVYQALAGIFSRFISSTDSLRLDAPGDADAGAYVWVDKIATPDLVSVAEEVSQVLDQLEPRSVNGFSWSMIREHLNSCHVYLAAGEILIRPLIPPTWNHAAFNSPRQRIYMSATLGAGGDLERLFGRRAIKRLPISHGWDRQGVGRRFFVFPGLSLKDEEVEQLNHDLMRLAGRSLVLVPSDPAAERVKKSVAAHLGYPTFTGADIEKSKLPFVGTQRAVAVVANRYDGIDFPGDERRLQIVQGLPKVVNLQERFLMARMGANVLFNERIQTRVLQAIGRCTRSLEDYSAVIVEGADFSDYLIDPKRRRFFHPELQAELWFGIEQSKGMVRPGLLENVNIFLNNRPQWEQVEQQIVQHRQEVTQEQFPGIEDLANAVGAEVQYQEAMWKADYVTAFEKAQSVVGFLRHESLRGYRAVWHYLAGSAAWLASQNGTADLVSQARQQFTEAKKAAAAVPWLSKLAAMRSGGETSPEQDLVDVCTSTQVEHLELVLEKLGTLHDRKFADKEKRILELISNDQNGPFEEGQRLLGEMLGMMADNSEEDAAPDPWWWVADKGIVFEDHSFGKATTRLGAQKGRQAALHASWLRENRPELRNVNFLPVLVSPVTRATEGAAAFLDQFSLWPLDEFRKWAKNSLIKIRELRTTFREPGDLDWRGRAYDVLRNEKISISVLVEELSRKTARSLLQVDLGSGDAE